MIKYKYHVLFPASRPLCEGFFEIITEKTSIVKNGLTGVVEAVLG